MSEKYRDKNKHMCAHMHAYSHIHMHAHAHTHAHTHAYRQAHMCMHIHTQDCCSLRKQIHLWVSLQLTFYKQRHATVQTAVHSLKTDTPVA